jgi:hypothetical protein
VEQNRRKQDDCACDHVHRMRNGTPHRRPSHHGTGLLHWTIGTTPSSCPAVTSGDSRGRLNTGTQKYRCLDGPDTTGGTMHDTKNTTRTRHDTMDIVSVPARHDGGLCLGRDLGTQCRHEHDTKRAAHPDTTATHLNTSSQPQAI